MAWNPKALGCGGQDAAGFIAHTLVRIPTGETAMFFRIVAVDTGGNSVRMRLERYTLFW